MALGYHVMCSLKDGRVIAPGVHERRLLARVVLEATRGRGLLAFAAPDTHLHMEMVEEREAAGELTRRIEISAVQRLELPVGFARAHIVPIETQRHLANAFDYILRQNARHGLTWDPLFESCNLPDLLGLRVLGQHTTMNVRRFLPRVNRGHLLSLLGISSLLPASEPLEELTEAALAAAALDDLCGRRSEKVAARRAVVAIARPRLGAARLASLLGIDRSTVGRELAAPAEPRLVAAIQLQLGLRLALRSTGSLCQHPQP